MVATCKIWWFISMKNHEHHGKHVGECHVYTEKKRMKAMGQFTASFTALLWGHPNTSHLFHWRQELNRSGMPTRKRKTSLRFAESWRMVQLDWCGVGIFHHSDSCGQLLYCKSLEMLYSIYIYYRETTVKFRVVSWDIWNCHHLTSPTRHKQLG